MNRDHIIIELKKKHDGYTISELAEKLKISRNTVAITFAYLEGADKVRIRHAGMAKIYHWRG